jgi:hypothetical protein
MRRVGSCPAAQGLSTSSTTQPGLARLPGWRGSIKEFPISPCRPGIGELLELDPVVHQIPWRDFADSFAPCLCFNSAEKLQSLIPGINCWIELSTFRSSIVCDLPFQRYDSRPRAFENPPRKSTRRHCDGGYQIPNTTRTNGPDNGIWQYAPRLEERARAPCLAPNPPSLVEPWIGGPIGFALRLMGVPAGRWSRLSPMLGRDGPP